MRKENWPKEIMGAMVTGWVLAALLIYAVIAASGCARVEARGPESHITVKQVGGACVYIYSEWGVSNRSYSGVAALPLSAVGGKCR